LKKIKDEHARGIFIAEKEKEYRHKFANPYNAAKFCYIDDVIEPRNTRLEL
jgi:acetyl-CoA carboxylase carboxyltransferase component